MSILSLAQRIKKLTRSNSNIKLVPYEEVFHEGFADMPRRVPCTNKLHSWTEYRPTLGLNAILQDIVEHFRESMSGGDKKKAA